MDHIFVKSEFAPLKRVVLAQSEFGFPTKELTGVDFLTEENQALFSGPEVMGKDFNEVFPEQQKAWEAERKNLQKVLEKYEVEVLIPRKLTTIEKELGNEYGYSNFFTRDPFFTIGDLLIEGSLKLAHRRNEILPIREILVNESNVNECLYFSIPKPDISQGIDSEQGPFLEGGDVLVLGKTIFAGNSGLASNTRGIQWLRNLVKRFDYEVIEVPLHPTILHLDCALSLVRDGLMIVCEEAFLNGIPEQLSKWDRVNVSLAQASRLATNGLPINETTYVTDPEFTFIGEELEKRGITVEYVDYKLTRIFGGSFRCSTQPLLRN
ncbi:MULTISPECIES: dimethylarginine dimethylaminohydrolase family protein [Enterococcus]|uniref:Amidinotransferase n=1 Tax=Candidatus Enterococcus mangumiae TaxID=2230878 RepID=A0ABZ2SYH2_9ENTE|nr:MULTISPECIES: arginine deiminase family protein [unclassified Enterococcus]MBO0462092.1 amidinotransferase [Enterococcus sp. DIV1298c]MBO0489622.1 amidinotransferase [Enterococcus sp. DIV1094]MBO1298440.1 amidinotransferase [Enterococcus sp. DIV1271a]